MRSKALTASLVILLQSLPSIQSAHAEAIQPGYYSLDSAVLGSRSNELNEMVALAEEHRDVGRFDDALREQWRKYAFIIPLERAQEAEDIARSILEKHLDQYKKEGITIDSVVQRDPHFDNPGRFQVYEASAQSPWYATVLVRKGGNYRGNGYLPESVAVLHEYQHAQEVVPGRPKFSSSPSGNKGMELMTSLTTLITLDHIYKQLHQKNDREEVDHGASLQWGKFEVPIGMIANFYRDLQKEYGSLAKAIASPASIEFITAGSMAQLKPSTNH